MSVPDRLVAWIRLLLLLLLLLVVCTEACWATLAACASCRREELEVEVLEVELELDVLLVVLELLCLA